jgi:pimeloyl-ACP methyl ester carboxylesterase
MQTSEECAWHMIAPPGLIVNVINLGGPHVFTLSAGEGSTPVVLISGLGDATLTWAPILPDLARYCRVITYDRPGIGASPPVEGSRSLERMAREISDLVASLEEGPAVLVGHSLGGLIALTAYRRRPDLLAGLVLIDPADPAIFARRNLVAIQQFSIWLPSALAAIGLWPRIARSVARREAAVAVRNSQVQDALANGLLENLLNVSSRRTSSAELAGLVTGSMCKLDDPNIGSIAVPLVVLSATKGGTSKRMRNAWTRNQRLLASRSFSGRHLEIDGGHYLHREQPSAVIREVLTLLKDIQKQ